MRAIAALCLAAPIACTAAVRPTAVAEPPGASPVDAGPPPPPQPGSVIATLGDSSVLALDAPSFAELPREQRLVAYWVGQAAAALDPLPWDQRSLEVVRLLRGILSRPAVVPALVLPRIGDFARAVYLNRGLHDSESRRKLSPPLSMSELRLAALAAQAAGADLGQQGGKLEYALRALDAVLFDPRVDPAPVAVPPGDRPERAASALDQALPFATPPQRALLEGLAAHLRGSEPLPGWVDVAAPVDFFIDRTHAIIGIVDTERSAVLQVLTPQPPRLAEALHLAGGRSPLSSLAFTLPGKAALFAAAGDALQPVRTAGLVSALADPALVPELVSCLPQHRFAFLALREVIDRRGASLDPTLDEARADATAHALAQESPLLEPGCRELWPQFAATHWFGSAAHLPQGDRVEDPRQRAIQLQIWWFTGKGALSERHQGGRRFLAADPARFQKSAAELLALLQDIASSHDMARLRDLLENHAAKLDTQWRDEVIERLRAAGVPRRVFILPPRIVEVVADGKVIDAQLRKVEDLDAEILRAWNDF